MKRDGDSASVPVSHIHANKYQERAQNKEKRNLLVQYQPGKDDGGDGIKVDVVGGYNGTQFLEHPVPSQKTQHRGQ